MQTVEKNAITFKSADGYSDVAGVVYKSSEVVPFCVVQMSHGMLEYMGRYDDFARFLCKNGVAFLGNDHIGHGDSATKENKGYFGKKGDHALAVKDIKTMNDFAHREFPSLPVILLGHSMGSFFARVYAARYPETIDGLILSGTAGKNPAAGAGIMLAWLLMKLRGARHASPLMQKMAFGKYLEKIPNYKTLSDWISRDEAIVEAYVNDPDCTFAFTVSGYHALLSALREVSSPKWAARIRKDMPLLMIQGSDDPVGAYNEGTAQVKGWLEDAGVKNLEYKLYEGARHEVLNETNRSEVYTDVLEFLKRNFT